MMARSWRRCSIYLMLIDHHHGRTTYSWRRIMYQDRLLESIYTLNLWYISFNALQRQRSSSRLDSEQLRDVRWNIYTTLLFALVHIYKWRAIIFSLYNFLFAPLALLLINVANGNENNVRRLGIILMIWTNASFIPV